MMENYLWFLGGAAFASTLIVGICLLKMRAQQNRNRKASEELPFNVVEPPKFRQRTAQSDPGRRARQKTARIIPRRIDDTPKPRR